MATIPLSHFSSVTPGVVSAGGAAVDLSGLFLTENTRVPIGTVLSLAPSAVAGYFGAASKEAGEAVIYGRGFDGCTQYPGAMLFAQYPTAAVAAYLRGGNFGAANTIAQMQTLSGSLTVAVDGYSHVISSISLASYTSYSAAATAIGSAFTDPTEASVTASIGGHFGTCTSSGTTLTLGSVTDGYLAAGDLVSGTDTTNSLPAGCSIVKQLTGTPGGSAGATFQLSAAATPGNLTSCTVTGTSTVIDVTAVASGTVAVGQTSSTTGNPIITAQLTGTAGSTGTYQLSGAEHGIASGSVTLSATAPVVTYDSVSGGFVVTSGITGAPSTAAYATGTLAASLLLTSATGAVLSQGAAVAVPGTFMDALIQVSQNWGGFTHMFDPDGGSGNTQKQAFAAWKNSQNNQYLYAAWDTDQSPVVSAPAASSLGAILAANGDSGTCPVSENGNLHLATFTLSYLASLNFSQQNGRFTAAYRSQAGLTASVSQLAAAENLEANGYNYYGAEGGRNPANNATFFYPGSVTGPFKWLDSYANQIWLNASLQQAGLVAMRNNPSLPYNVAGYGKVRAGLLDPINAALNYGAIQAGVTFSSAQIAAVNSAAGKAIDQTLSHQGWYLLISDADPTTRAARTSPLIIFFYSDGGSIQSIDLSSLMIQ